MPLNDFEKQLATRIIGIEFGLKRIGLSYSDENKVIAMPLMTVTAEKKTDLTVAKLLQELKKHQQDHHYMIEEIVIGLPLLMSGKTGFLADEVHFFIAQLKESTTVPITTWDERLTSVQAERTMREGSMSRKKRSEKVDVVAAVIILQNYLDFKYRSP
jgi:putative Holliday junction resolvase